MQVWNYYRDYRMSCIWTILHQDYQKADQNILPPHNFCSSWQNEICHTLQTPWPQKCVWVCGGVQSRGVSERWESLSELGHLSQLYPCTFPDPPRGTDSGSRWGLVNSMWGTVSCVLSAKGVCVRVSLSLLLYLVRHFTPRWGSKFTLASTWCTHRDRATWE